MTESSTLLTLTNIFIAIIGAAVGSFLNVCIYRLPRRVSIIKPFSFCPACKNRIKFYHNIPILSFLFLRAKCAYCGAKISLRYPFVEALTALIAWSIFQKFGFKFATPIYFIFACALIVATFVDFDFKIIPDEVTLGGLALGLIASPLLPHGIKGALFGAFLGGGLLWLVAFVYEKVTHREGMGLGDVKFLAMMGAFLGPKSIILIILVASLFGSAVGIVMMVFFKKDRLYALPFGPFLALGAIVTLFFGEQLWNLILRF